MKITKRVILLCIALTIAVVVTFGRRDGQPNVDNTDASNADNPSLDIANGLDAPATAALPPLADVPVFGPQDKGDTANDGLASLAALPDLPDVGPPAAATDTTNPDATTSPLPPALDAPPKIESLSGSGTKNTNAATNGLGLPDLPGLIDNPLADSPSLNSPPDMGAFPSLTPLATPASPTPDALKEDKSALLDAIKMPTAEMPKAPAPEPLADFPPPFSPSVADTKPTLPEPLAAEPSEPVAKVAQLPTVTNPLSEFSNTENSLPAVPPPTLNTLTPPSVKPAPIAAAPSLSTPSPQARTVPPPLSAAPSVAPTRPAPQTRQSFNTYGTQRHRIVDGDTLQSISQRYLGTPERAHEIFAANRNVLPAPDVLPLGANLVVPAGANNARTNTRARATIRQPAPQPRTAPQPRVADPFLAIPTGLPAANRTNTRPNLQAIPETRRPVAKPVPTLVEDGSVQNRSTLTRLVPVPAAR